MERLPPGREPGRYRIELVCLGNICRSPMAHVVLEERLAGAGLADVVEVTSSGTGDWHVGNPMDRRAAATLTAAGYDASRHRARQWTDLDAADLYLAMDADNLGGIGGPGERARMFRDLDPTEAGADVPDPYYGGDDGFEEVLGMVERTASAIVEALRRERPWEPSAP
ncbi:low molecular weight protein-tyrosine-phosphatase [Nocardioides sp. YIM 152315]|uniref:low molecular weight protein-tyrosine-phosphatase n=1 Tax=Nocardioides sp. YIM 152315 TaxID=3031760 RepID=UPI0023D98227|nr:low molecular weight protein-tyrosine-phosphatase [Nocardioides sp. YIM 152315]MDF1604286.1 low molecular weight phosphotyrosine protein phosphatase [Nocardioides sp. YIM 152315]